MKATPYSNKTCNILLQQHESKTGPLKLAVLYAEVENRSKIYHPFFVKYPAAVLCAWLVSLLLDGSVSCFIFCRIRP